MRNATTSTIAAATILAFTLAGCGAQVDVKPEGENAQYAQRTGLAYDPCPGQVINLGSTDPVWCGRYVRNMSEDEKAKAREDMSKIGQSIADGIATDVPTGTATTEAAPVDVPPTTGSDGPAVDEVAGVHAFGTTVTTEMGNEMTVGKPEKFTPSQYAAGSDGGPATKFKVTFKNTTSEPIDLSMSFSASASHDDKEAESILDSENGINAAPTTAVRPGKAVTFYIAFAGKPSGVWNVDLEGADAPIMFSSDAT